MNAMKKLAIPLFLALAYGPAQGLAAPILGPDLATFAVLGATGSTGGVTNVPTSTIGGNLGSAPNPAAGGGYIFTSGSLQQNTILAQSAQIQLDTAIVSLSAFGVGINTGPSLDVFQASQVGSVIGPGTYTVAAVTTPNLAGALVLDGGGSNSALWVFQFPSTLITGTSSTVTVQNVGTGANVGIYWNVHSAATLNGNVFAGNVLASQLISSDGNLTIACGRLLSAEAAVTLIADHISIGCTGSVVTGSGGANVASSGGFDQGVGIGSGGTGGSGGQVVGGVPEPGTVLLFGFGLAGLFVFRKKLFPVA